MKYWYICLLLLSLKSFNFAVDVEDDDGVLIEDEQVVDNPKTASEVLDLQINYQSPYIQPGKYHFAEHFDDPKAFEENWIKSKAKKDNTEEGKYNGEWSVEPSLKQILKNDLGLVLKSKAKHAAIASRLVKPFVFSDKPLIVQYEVQLQDGQECGGSYVKLLSSGPETTDLGTFYDKTPYTIMFGPDKCGNDNKLHFIFRHVNPTNGTVEEKHCSKPKGKFEEVFTDKKPHLYQLLLRPDNTFSISIDHQVVNEGSLLTDFQPPVNPPKEIDDPNDFKPDTWDEREKIPDPTAEKPDDWDEDEPPQIPDPNASKPGGWLDNEEEMTPDPNAVRPDDWDDEIDGEWEAPLIANPICEKAVGCGLWKAPLVSNPKYKGKWRASLIENPNYQGKWSPKRIQNPHYFEDLSPFKMTPISAVGLELWSMSQDILFDNILITDDIAIAREYSSVTFDLKQKQIDLESNPSTQKKMENVEQKPGWWTIYIIYCLTPVLIYIWYLYKRCKEETIWQRITRLTDGRPWLLIVFVLAGVLPISLFVYIRCCKDTTQKPLHPKKTDQPQSDNEGEGEGEVEIEGDEVEEELELNEDETNDSPRPTKKSDLDEAVATSSVDEQDDDNDKAAAPSEGARKRKPRKD